VLTGTSRNATKFTQGIIYEKNCCRCWSLVVRAPRTVSGWLRSLLQARGESSRVLKAGQEGSENKNDDLPNFGRPSCCSHRFCLSLRLQGVAS